MENQVVNNSIMHGYDYHCEDSGGNDVDNSYDGHDNCYDGCDDGHDNVMLLFLHLLSLGPSV